MAWQRRKLAVMTGNAACENNEIWRLMQSSGVFLAKAIIGEITSIWLMQWRISKIEKATNQLAYHRQSAQYNQ
jgi:hypothetical protein